MSINIGKMFANRAFLTPNLEACVGDGYRYNYEKVNQRINRFASYLTANGLVEGDRIAVLCKNNEQVTTAMFAAAKVGIITVLLNYRLQTPELMYILSDCGASLLLYDSEFGQTADSIRDSSAVKLFVGVGCHGNETEFEAVLGSMSEDEPAIKGSGNDPAVLMYTSGTTGKPKGVILTHNNLFWASIGLAHTVDWAHKYRYLSVAPLFHIGGLAPIFANIHVGCTTVFMPDFDPVKAWQTIEQEKINFAMTVPVMLQFMQLVPDIDKMDLSSLKHLICGGSAVPQSLIADYREKGIDVHQVYGATEYSGAISFWSPDMGFEKSNSMGKMVFHGDVRILDPNNGKEMLTGEVGEICILGPQVFKGYWDNEKATNNALINGYYRSGDLGLKDDQGFLYVVDRLKDMIISGGENIYPAEIESVIRTKLNVADVAVVGKPDAKWGEVPIAFIVKGEGSELEESKVIDVCRDNLAKYKCVKQVVFVNEIPKNTLGKVLKRSLREKIN